MDLPPRRSNILDGIDSFIQIKEAGSGGYSVVYEVEDRVTRRKYALKKMDMKRLSARNRENIIKEIRAHSQMDHPNIIKMIDFMERGQFIYILLEYAPSGNLFHFINSKPMSQDFICKLFTQVAMAIDHVHSKGFIHRDLKPENILLDGNMNAQLCDFGWAASFNDTEYRYQTAGTYEYMSPEALQNRAQNKEADVWALGVLLYELHHIQEPFPGRSSREVLESIRRKKVEFFRDVPIEARNLILEILAIEPEKRPTIRKILSSPYLQKYNRGSLGQTNPTHSAPLNPFVSNRFAPSPQTRDEQNYKSNPQAGTPMQTYQNLPRSQAVKHTLQKLEQVGVVTKRDVVNQQPNPLLLGRDLKINLNSSNDNTPMTSVSPARMGNLGDSPINAISVIRDGHPHQLRLHTPAQQTQSPFKLNPRQMFAEEPLQKRGVEPAEIKSLSNSQIRQVFGSSQAFPSKGPQTFGTLAKEFSSVTSKTGLNTTPTRAQDQGASQQQGSLQHRIIESSQAIALAKQTLQRGEKGGIGVPSRVPNPVISVTEWASKEEQGHQSLDKSGISTQGPRVFTFGPSPLQSSVSNGNINTNTRPDNHSYSHSEVNPLIKPTNLAQKGVTNGLVSAYLDSAALMRTRPSNDQHVKTMSIASTTNGSNKTARADMASRQSGEYVIITSNQKPTPTRNFDETINRGSAPMAKDEDGSGSTLRLSETLQNKKVLKRTISEVESEASRSNSPGQRFMVEPRKTFDLKLSATDKHTVTGQSGSQYSRANIHVQYGIPNGQPSRQDAVARTSYQDMTIQQKSALKPLDFGTVLSQTHIHSAGLSTQILRSAQNDMFEHKLDDKGGLSVTTPIKIVGSTNTPSIGGLGANESNSSMTRLGLAPMTPISNPQPKLFTESFHNIYTDLPGTPASQMRKEPSVEPQRVQQVRSPITPDFQKRFPQPSSLGDAPVFSSVQSIPQVQIVSQQLKSGEQGSQIQRLSTGLTMISNQTRSDSIPLMNQQNVFAKPASSSLAYGPCLPRSHFAEVKQFANTVVQQPQNNSMHSIYRTSGVDLQNHMVTSTATSSSVLRPRVLTSGGEVLAARISHDQNRQTPVLGQRTSQGIETRSSSIQVDKGLHSNSRGRIIIQQDGLSNGRSHSITSLHTGQSFQGANMSTSALSAQSYYGGAGPYQNQQVVHPTNSGASIGIYSSSIKVRGGFP